MTQNLLGHSYTAYTDRLLQVSHLHGTTQSTVGEQRGHVADLLFLSAFPLLSPVVEQLEKLLEAYCMQHSSAKQLQQEKERK